MFTLIVATDSKGGIGKSGKIPWKVKADMEHFKYKTTGGIVVMGRKTWESIPKKSRPLPNMMNVVVSRNPDFVIQDDSVMLFNDLRKCVNWLQQQPREIFIIGGKHIYDWFMEQQYIKRVLLTTIFYDFQCDRHIGFSTHSSDEWVRVPHELVDPVTLAYRLRMKKESTYLIEYAEYTKNELFLCPSWE